MKNLFVVLFVSTFVTAAFVAAQEVPQTGFEASIPAASSSETTEGALWNKKHHHHHHRHHHKKCKPGEYGCKIKYVRHIGERERKRQDHRGECKGSCSRQGGQCKKKCRGHDGKCNDKCLLQDGQCKHKCEDQKGNCKSKCEFAQQSCALDCDNLTVDACINGSGSTEESVKEACIGIFRCVDRCNGYFPIRLFPGAPAKCNSVCTSKNCADTCITDFPDNLNTCNALCDYCFTGCLSLPAATESGCKTLCGVNEGCKGICENTEKACDDICETCGSDCDGACQERNEACKDSCATCDKGCDEACRERGRACWGACRSFNEPGKDYFRHYGTDTNVDEDFMDAASMKEDPAFASVLAP